MAPKIPFKIRIKWIFDKHNRFGFISRLRVLLGGYTPTLIIYFIQEVYLKDFEEVVIYDEKQSSAQSSRKIRQG